MKRNILLIIFAFLVFISVHTVLAQEMSSSSALPSSGQATVSATPVPYVLPYPGLLPDHPLWFIKAARDRIIAFLISDPLKKSEFDIKQADKRLAAGIALFKKDKPDLAISTISKGENYLEEGEKNLTEAKKEGKDIKDLFNTLKRSSQKHDEVLTETEKTLPQDKKEALDKEKRRVEKVMSQLEELK